MTDSCETREKRGNENERERERERERDEIKELVKQFTFIL
jgi:hypothetical protein